MIYEALLSSKTDHQSLKLFLGEQTFFLFLLPFFVIMSGIPVTCTFKILERELEVRTQLFKTKDVVS